VDGDHAGALGERQRRSQPIREKSPVRQVGQRVVMRHMRNQRLGAPLLGDVEMGGHETAALERSAADLEHGAVRARAVVDMRLLLARQPHTPLDMLGNGARSIFAAFRIEAEQLFQARKTVGEEVVRIVE